MYMYSTTSCLLTTCTNHIIILILSICLSFLSLHRHHELLITVSFYVSIDIPSSYLHDFILDLLCAGCVYACTYIAIVSELLGVGVV